MGMMETKDLRWIEPDIEEVKKISVQANEALKDVVIEPVKNAESEVANAEDNSPFAKMKRMVRKAVNCCIE